MQLGPGQACCRPADFIQARAPRLDRQSPAEAKKRMTDRLCPAPTRSALRGQLSVLVLLLGLVGCDHGTKSIAKAALEGLPPQALIARVVDLRYVENTDVAFNLLRRIPEETRIPLLLAVSTLAILALGVAVLRQPGPRSMQVGLVFILAGALGNFLDRLFRGYVVDFVHVAHWPVFNVADVLVTAGVILFIGTRLKS
jgi:signal peptidase II